MFLGGVTRKVSVFDMPPPDFVRELAKRWELRHPVATKTEDGPVIRQISDEMPPGAVFISYMREDVEAVRHLVSRLQTAGVNVWLDLNSLKAGMSFNTRIEEYIASKCALFVSVISRQTEQHADAYAHRERNWAAKRAEGIADAERDKFYIPLIIDDELDPGQIRNEPFIFKAVHRPSICPEKLMTISVNESLTSSVSG